MEQALREPMQAIGWRPRAAGWFTRSIAPEYTGVLAASVASRYAAAGTGHATLFVHLRRDDVQPVVRELLQSTYQDGGYRSTSAVTSIGYLMPAPTWRSWLVTPETAAPVAAELAAATRDHAQPYLERLAADPERVLQAVKSSGTIMASAAGPCTVAVLLARLGRPDEGWAFIQQHLSSISSRTDPAAQDSRQMADRLRHWLDRLPR